MTYTELIGIFFYILVKTIEKYRVRKTFFKSDS